MPPPLTWHIFEIIMNCIFHCHCLCFKLVPWTLHFAISMSLKPKEKNEICPFFYNLMEDYSCVVDGFILLVSITLKGIL